MLNKYDLRPVTIGCFKGITSGGYITGAYDGTPKKVVCVEVDEKSLKDIICIIDEEHSNAIDIITGDFYHIIKRDKNDRIIETIDYDNYYALKVKNNKDLTHSFLYNLYFNCLAENAYNSYKNNFQENAKVLTLKNK